MLVMSPDDLNAGTLAAHDPRRPCRTDGALAPTDRRAERAAFTVATTGVRAGPCAAAPARGGCRRSSGTRPGSLASRRTACPTPAERGRLAGLHGDAVKDHLSARAENVQDQVALANRASAREDEQVFLERLVERARDPRACRWPCGRSPARRHARRPRRPA